MCGKNKRKKGCSRDKLCDAIRDSSMMVLERCENVWSEKIWSMIEGRAFKI
jgi:hypothetical protein